MKTKFAIKDRLLIFAILPKEGDILTLKAVKSLREELAFTKEEKVKFDITFDKEMGKYTWNEEKPYEKDLEITDEQSQLISSELESLNRQKKLRIEHIDLYERFCQEE